MTPAEKAKELIDKFLLEITGVDRYSYNVDSMNVFSAKQCALIAVDEIIKEYGTYYKVEVDGKYVSYWKEVKQEIEKL